MVDRPDPIIPRKPFIDLIQEMKLDDFATINFKCLKYVSGNISLTEIFTIVMAVALFKPKRIMEFGTFNGRTTLNMAINFDGKITTVDLPKRKKLRTKYPLEDKGNQRGLDESGYVGNKAKLWVGQGSDIVGRITQIWEDTAQLKFNEHERQYDFVFIDASHSYENCKNDSYNAHSLLIPGRSIIFWHDYNGWPGVTEALNEYYIQQEKPEKMYWFNDTSIVGRFF